MRAPDVTFPERRAGYCFFFASPRKKLMLSCSGGFELVLSNKTPLDFSLTLKPEFGSQTLETMGDAVRFVAELTPEQRESSHWKRAIFSLGTAVREPRYVALATINLQTALAMELMLRDSDGA
jgi:hypothetical protein